MNQIAWIVLLSSVLFLGACASDSADTKTETTTPKKTAAPMTKTSPTPPTTKTTIDMAKPKNQIEIMMEGDQSQKVQFAQPKATINGQDVTAKPSKKKVEVKEKKAPPPKSSNPAPVEEVKNISTKIPANTLSEAKPIEEITKSVSTPPAAPSAPKSIEKVETPASAPKVVALAHGTWDALLRKHVSASGKVNYKGFKKDKAAFDAYLDLLANNPVQSDWSRGKKMAYWINAYNAYTIKKIVDNHPISSITKLDGGKPWDKKWIKLGDKTYTLNNIENDILRPKYKDARIHFAVNCAAQSCPPILNRAWTAKNLDSNFEKQAKAFINNSKYNKIGAKKVEISKIFEWYAGDFGNIIDYLNKYSDTKINANAKVSYLEYDWALNE